MERIKMLRTMDGSHNGIAVHRYYADTEYAVHPALKLDPKHPHVSPDLARVFVTEGWAEEVGAADDPKEGAPDAIIQGDDSPTEGAGDSNASEAPDSSRLRQRRRRTG